jgi:hypothetical protein
MGKLMKDAETLEESNIQDGNVLHLIASLENKQTEQNEEQGEGNIESIEEEAENGIFLFDWSISWRKRNF